MDDIGNKNYKSKPDKILHQMRFCAQIAEKAGYTIAGVGSAYVVAGIYGVIAFGIYMLLFANLQSQIIHIWKLPLGPITLRVSLGLRATSFAALAYGVVNGSIEFMLLGAALSGLFVGLFWPTFYTLKQESITAWFVIEKVSGVFLTVSTGLLVIYWDLIWILLFSFVATTASFCLTFRIRSQNHYQPLSMLIQTPHLQRARRMAFIDGSIGESSRMIRRLALLGGSVTFFNLEGILSFALVLGLSDAFGAILNKSKRFTAFHSLCITIIGCMACIISKETWLYGLILLGIGLSALFPVVQEEIKSHIQKSGQIDLNFRERHRIEGRVLGAVIAAMIYLLPLPMEIVFLGIFVSLIALARLSDEIQTPGFRALTISFKAPKRPSKPYFTIEQSIVDFIFPHMKQQQKINFVAMFRKRK